MFTTAYLFKRENYQVDGAMAFVTMCVRVLLSRYLAQPPRHRGSSSDKPPPPDRVMSWIIAFIMWSHATFATPEQRKRDFEYNSKKQTLLAEVLGNKHEYACVSILVADPSVHGKQYETLSALLH